MYPQIRRKLVLTCLLLAATACGVRAQEGPSIKWHTDYNTARKESEKKNLPVLIDFVRPNCPPCDRMERETFRDPRIVGTLNGKFVPLKINGFEQTDLAARLGISAYPTLVLAGADGRIVDNLVGFQDADSLNDRLQRMVTSSTPAEGLQKDFDIAVKWEKDGEFARAIIALRAILDDGKGAALQKNAQELMKKIEKRAEDRLTLAKALQEKGQAAEALETLSEVVRTFPGLQASRDATDQIAKLAQVNEGAKTEQRNKRVRQLLGQAQDFYKSKDYIPCLDRCEIILANYGDLPEGQQAFALASEIKNNRDWLQSAADVTADRLGSLWLALADSCLKQGEVQKAQHHLQNVVRAFPGSRVAESAQIRLTQLRGTSPGTKTETARP